MEKGVREMGGGRKILRCCEKGDAVRQRMQERRRRGML